MKDMETTGVAETMSRNMSFREIILAGTGEDEIGVIQDLTHHHAELISDHLVLRLQIEKDTLITSLEFTSNGSQCIMPVIESKGNTSF